MVCSNCGTENLADKRFCGDCGTALASGCPTCGATNPPGKRFCGDCGTALGAVSSSTSFVIPHAVPAPIAERRVVSVLFADLVGFTTLAEGRDAEDTRELLSRYFELCDDVITRYGGTVEKFIGDAVMAIWGAPIAREDDAERAVRAGLELVDAVKALGPGIQARAGVLTGEAAVTIGATNQGMVAGDLVNTASRLQSVARPGTVLVGEATQRAASLAIVFEPSREKALKGKTAPTPAFRALRVVAERGGRNRSEALEAPFVGRDDELRLLKDLFHATTRENRARLVSVIGPAGIGKTRLAWEFSKDIDDLVEPIWLHQGRSPSYGDGISFWALGEMVRRRAGLLETDDEPTTRAKVAETVAEHVADESERRWIEPALLVLLGIDTGAAASDELFSAWRTFFERLSATGTVVMVFEDVHWADTGLLDFIDEILEWSRSFPIYVVTLARPELLERRPDWGAGKRSFSSLYVEPLPEADMRDLLGGLVPGLPASSVASIVARAEGVPLYAVETVRMLLAQGKVKLTDGVYAPSGDFTTLAVPESLTALIAARLDGLGSTDRSLIQDAAVLGGSFTAVGLEAVSGILESDLEPHLQSLVRRQMLFLVTDPRSPERGQYGFVQALIREVAYSTLAKRDRKSRHLAAAKFLEGLDSDEIAGGLAGHYLAAYRNSPASPDADAIATHARIALMRAAERAIELGSNEQAHGLFGEALELTMDPVETGDLLERAGAAAGAAGRYEAAESHLRQALVLRRELADRPAAARTIAALGRTLLDAWHTTDALLLLEPAAAEFADLTPDPGNLALGAQLARAYFLHQEYDRAIEVAEPVIASAVRGDLVAILADTLVTKGSSLSSLRRVVEGLDDLRAGQELAQAHGLNEIVARAVNNRTGEEVYRDPRSAFDLCLTGLALARRLGHRTLTVTLLVHAGWCALRMGDWRWIRTELAEWQIDELETGDQIGLGLIWIPLCAFRGVSVDDSIAKLDGLVGDDPDPAAIGVMETIRTWASFAAGRWNETRVARHRAAEAFASPEHLMECEARVALWSGDESAAVDDLDLLERAALDGPAYAADRLTIQAGIAALRGHQEIATAAYHEALRSWRDLGLAWDEALCGLDMAVLLDPTDPKVVAAAKAAREILVELEASPFIARLDSALARSAGPSGRSPVKTL